MIIIGVDNGNTYTKTAHCSFPSGIKLLDTDPPIMPNDLLEIGKNKYALVNERLVYIKDKTKDESLYYITLMAVAKEILISKYPTKTDIILAIGLPPGHYSLLAEKYKQYFLQHGENISFKYNSVYFNLKLKDVYVFPQAFSAGVTQVEELSKYTRSYIIDIGGYTVDTLLLVNGTPDMSYVESLEIGVINMYNSVKRKVDMLLDMKIEDSDIEELMFNKKSNNVLSDNDEIKEIIFEEGKAHCNKIINMLRERGIDLKTNYAIFIGGGSLLLKNFIKEMDKVGKHIILEDTKSNALGYTLLAERKANIRGEH